MTIEFLDRPSCERETSYTLMKMSNARTAESYANALIALSRIRVSQILFKLSFSGFRSNSRFAIESREIFANERD